MIKIVSVFNAFSTMIKKTEAKNGENRVTEHVREARERRWRDDTSKERHRSTMNGDIPFAVRYIKLVVECFESYHSHFDELARRIDRREDSVFRHRYIYLLNR